MSSKAGRAMMVLLIVLQYAAVGQGFISREEALAWIGDNIENSTTVPIRYHVSPAEYEFGEDVRFFKLSKIDGCKLILERYEHINGQPQVKSVYEVLLEEIDPENIRMSIEKYSRNICLVLKPDDKRKKIKVTRLSGKNYRFKQVRKKKSIILEFNQEAIQNNIHLQMQKAFQYSIQKCNQNSTILNYIYSLNF
ncbi:MAG: hypothetical protein JSV24_03490 [Bacteroidales bacterium]|nr:MAG: hypothetical protein JSV24_03490 [Bacteroidales bacterium]